MKLENGVKAVWDFGPWKQQMAVTQSHSLDILVYFIPFLSHSFPWQAGLSAASCMKYNKINIIG